MSGILAVVPFAVMLSGNPLDATPRDQPSCSARFNNECVFARFGGSYYYVTGLDPYGDNWLALRDQPSFNSSWSPYVRMGPGTPVSVIGSSGEWLRVRLLSGDVGWANSQYLACCR